MKYREYKQKVFAERPDVKQEYEKLGEPLSLEALRGMKNEPVYLRVFDKNLESGWHIVKTVTQGKIIFSGWNKAYVPVEGLGKDYNLYRYPPLETDLKQDCNDVATDTDVGSTLKEWEPCEFCRDWHLEKVNVKPCGNGDMGVYAEVGKVNNDEKTGIVIFCDNLAAGYVEFDFCPFCGKPQTEEARTMLEKRLRGCE